MPCTSEAKLISNVQFETRSISTANETPERENESRIGSSSPARLNLQFVPKSLRVPTRSFFQKVSERLRSTSVASSSDSDASDSE